MVDKVLFSSKSDDWKTPSILYKHFMDHGFFDPCPFKCEVDNLFKDFQKDRYFINPPYSDIERWVHYAISLSFRSLVFLLIPSRTDTKYFSLLYKQNAFIWFFRGRLHFNDKGSAPFPSCLVILGARYFEKNYDSGSIEDFIKSFNESKFIYISRF